MSNPTLDQDRVLFLAARNEVGRRVLPPWPRIEKELRLVEVEVEWVRFSTLNHRTRAEQKRAIHDSGRSDLFSADPLGDEAQEAQYKILCGQEGFEDLKRDLKDRGQQEPAVITAEGILVNGNRRSAALRTLYKVENHLAAKYVTCLVLPEDVSHDELVDLEAELQVARDFKEDYSWINQAFLIEELYDREGKDFDRVAKRMHRDVSSVRLLHEKLQQVHQLVALSDGARLHVDFNDNESAFDELVKHVRNKQASEVDGIRAVYFLGTLSNVQYRKLRHLRREDAGDLLQREIEEDQTLKPILDLATSAPPANMSDELLDDILGTSGHLRPLDGMLSFLAKKRPEETFDLSTGDRVLTNDVLNSLRSVITAVADEASEDRKDQTAVRAPLDRVDKAISSLEKALEVLPKARAYKEWNETVLSDKLRILGELLARFEEGS